MLKVEHIGIAVKNLQQSNKLFTSLLNANPYKTEEVASESVVTSFFSVGDTKVELLQSMNDTSAIARFIDKRGEGVHHIAYLVKDIRAEMQRLKNNGFELLNDEPREGADNKLVAFIHPKSANGVLVEICQEKT